MHASSRSPAGTRASTCRFEIPLADDRSGRWRREVAGPKRPAWWPCAAIPPLQPQPPVGATKRSSRRVQHPADGRADLFLPAPHEHERARPAAPGPIPAVAPRRTRWTCSPTRPVAAHRAANAHPGAHPPELWASPDMSIQLKAANGAICTLSPSSTNDGPLGALLPLHRRHRHPHRALRRPVQRCRTTRSTCPRSMCR